jgi:hypothetical protein
MAATRFHTPCVNFISLLLLAASFTATPALAQTDTETAEPEAEVPDAESHPPRDNSEFLGVKTTAPATRRFEMYSPHSPEALQALKEMGFTQVILDWPHLHPQATAIGLDVVLANWWTDKTPQEEIDRGLERAGQVARGRLAGISVMDEPERNSPETPFGFYIELYKTLRPRLDRELPGVPLEISHWGPLAGWDQRYYEYFSYLYEAADVMRIMPYPDLHEGPLGDVYLMMLRSREVMRIADRELPLVVILQTWVLPPRSLLPEIAELRVMAWQALLGGAEIVSFFDYNTDVWAEKPGFQEGFTDLMRELTQLSRRLSGATIESWMSADGVLHATATWPTGASQQILVNTNRTRVGELDALAIVESPVAGALAARSPSTCAPETGCVRCGPKSVIYRSRTRVDFARRPCAPPTHRRAARAHRRAHSPGALGSPRQIRRLSRCR